MKSLGALKSLIAKRAAVDKQIAAAEKKLFTEAETVQKAAGKPAKKPAAKKTKKPTVKKPV